MKDVRSGRHCVQVYITVLLRSDIFSVFFFNNLGNTASEKQAVL